MNSPLLTSALDTCRAHLRIASGATITILAARLAAMIVVTMAAVVTIGMGRAYAQSSADSTDVQIAPSPGAQPGIGNREVEQAAAALEQLARSNFGDLDDAELKLVHAAPQRALIWVGPNTNINSPDNDPSNASQWPPARTIRAALLRWLAADPQARPYVHPSGIGIGGAVIDGQLDLSYLTLNSPLTIVSSSIPEGMDFSFAHLQGLDLSR
ncbi:MAG: hypothetical protein ACREPW_11620, partial [Candidatus Binataceae bacterium]